ncbi:hypothetical protein MMC22_003388 [Lobaria immixta]|nr:hypothetical protein [Lobaria immixta]
MDKTSINNESAQKATELTTQERRAANQQRRFLRCFERMKTYADQKIPTAEKGLSLGSCRRKQRSSGVSPLLRQVLESKYQKARALQEFESLPGDKDSLEDEDSQKEENFQEKGDVQEDGNLRYWSPQCDVTEKENSIASCYVDQSPQQTSALATFQFLFSPPSSSSSSSLSSPSSPSPPPNSSSNSSPNFSLNSSPSSIPNSSCSSLPSRHRRRHTINDLSFLASRQYPSPRGAFWPRSPEGGLRYHATVQPSDPWFCAYSRSGSRETVNRVNCINENAEVDAEMRDAEEEVEVHIEYDIDAEVAVEDNEEYYRSRDVEMRDAEAQIDPNTEYDD